MIQGIEAFTAAEDAPPDAVMIASNFWDIAGLCVSTSSLLLIVLLREKIHLIIAK